MKKFILIAAFCQMVFSVCQGQITIGQTDMPAAGDTLRVSYSVSVLDPSVTGPNHTWDYSYLIANSQWVEKFDNPGSFSFPFNVLFNPFNTTYGQQQYTPDSIPGIGIGLADAYGFFKLSTTALKQLGLGLSVNGLPIPFDYSPDDIIYNFPLNYGDKDSCDAQLAPPSAVPLPFYYGQKIHRVNTVDGWGSLTTPYGTFASLRVRSAIAIRDTFADSAGVGYAISRPMQYEYKWLVQGGKVPYLQVNTNDVAGVEVVNRIAYRDSMRTGSVQIGVNDIADLNFNMQLFPNPAADYAFVQYSLINPQDVKLELLDINGKTINIIRSSWQAAGQHLELINLRSLNFSHGTYFVCLSTAQGRVLKKIVVAQ